MGTRWFRTICGNLIRGKTEDRSPGGRRKSEDGRQEAGDMGSEAACTLRLDGRATRGAALLEQRELIFRGAFRLAIALAEIQSARADGGSLAIRFGGRTATFELGPLAAKWAEKIIHPRSRADKL